MYDHGQLDLVMDVRNATNHPHEVQDKIEILVGQIAATLVAGSKSFDGSAVSTVVELPATEEDKHQAFNYTRSRQIDRPQTQDIIANLFESFVELRFVYGQTMSLIPCSRGFT